MKSAITQACFWAGVLLVLAITTQAQTYSNLYGFSNPNSSLANSDGGAPYCGLVLSSNVLYGTTWVGGSNGNGTVFAVHTDGTGFTNLHTFGPPYVTTLGATNSDGVKPHDTLAWSGNMLYGTTSQGGTNGYGTIFRLNTDGSGFTTLHSFGLGTDGISPNAGLIIAGNTLYGTATYGGVGAGFGTVFKLNTNGTGYLTLHSFNAGNNDGAYPNGGVVLSGGTLFGMASGGGGTSGKGVIFALSTNGTGNGSGYTNLYVFTGNSKAATTSTNGSGSTPQAGLVIAGNTLYGTTCYGGTNDNGVLFAINTNGLGMTNLHTFAFGNHDPNNSNYYTNRDGAYPLCTLALSGGTLYGTASSGGTQGYGTVFAVNTNGTGFINLYNFQSIITFSNTTIISSGGNSPQEGVIVSGNILYGTTYLGGDYGNVFALSLPRTTSIPLGIQTAGGKLVLSWSSSAFSLQSTPAFGITFSNVVGASSPYTNPAAGSQQFFRLQAN